MSTLQATIRPAWGADLRGLGRIDPELSRPGFGQKAVRLINQGRAWVADIGGAPVGYAVTSQEFFARPLVERVFVTERFRRQGLGLAMLMRCETAHQDSGIIYNLGADDPDLIYVKLRPPPLTFVKYQPSE